MLIRLGRVFDFGPDNGYDSRKNHTGIHERANRNRIDLRGGQTTPSQGPKLRAYTAHMRDRGERRTAYGNRARIERAFLAIE